jgi:hypothetical protein
MMTFSYSSFAVSVSEQIVTFDWLSLICTRILTHARTHTRTRTHNVLTRPRLRSGTVGGAATFACYLHEIAMIIYTKGRQWLCALCCAGNQTDADVDAADDADADEEADRHRAGVGAEPAEAPPPTSSAPQAVPSAYQVRRSYRRSRVLVPDLLASVDSSPQPRRRIFL